MSTTTSHSIKRVALVGASGNLGPSILSALLSASFTVTVLTRHDSTTPASLPASVNVVPVDYDSPKALLTALTGHDAVVSTIAMTAIQTQLAIIDAAVEAGVKRFIPSEFGPDTTNPRVAALPLFGGKIAVRKHLEAKTAAHPGFSYTMVVTGPFLDWGVQANFLLDVEGKQARLFDGGRNEFDTTLLADVGRAIVGVLGRPEETANADVYVRSARVTLRGLLGIVQEVTGREGWKEEDVGVEGMVKDALEEMTKGKADPMPWIVPMVHASIFGGKAYGQPFKRCDNDLLELKELSMEELRDVVKEIVKGSGK